MGEKLKAPSSKLKGNTKDQAVKNGASDATARAVPPQLAIGNWPFP